MQSILPKSEFTCYDDVLDMQLPMLRQIVEWLNQKRITVECDRIQIIGATHQISNYIPNIEE